MKMSYLRGDITALAVDAIVNAANETLLGGGGVDGAIHRVAGPDLLKACRAIGGCGVGQARITHGYGLPAGWIIHTVGPRYRDRNAKDLLASCYQVSLDIANAYGCKRVAFPCIGTGAYGYPPDKACAIAVQTVSLWKYGHVFNHIEEVIFCCFSDEDARLYDNALMPGF